MTPGIKASVSSVAIALAITAVGAVGTAYAATPADSGATALAAQSLAFPPPPPRPPHKFRQRFRSIRECQQRADREHRGRRSDWECRQGHDRNNPWEYWGR